MMMMTMMLTLEITREKIVEMVFEAALGRVVEVVVVALATLFWRTLTKAVVTFLRKMGRRVLDTTVKVYVVAEVRWTLLREFCRRNFLQDRRAKAIRCHGPHSFLPLGTAAC